MSLYSTAISCMGRESPEAYRAATYSEIISSSSRYLSVAGPVMPGRSFSTSLSFPTSLSAYPGTSGRGPTKLILPMSALRRLADATRSFFRADGNHSILPKFSHSQLPLKPPEYINPFRLQLSVYLASSQSPSLRHYLLDNIKQLIYLRVGLVHLRLCSMQLVQFAR